MYRIIQTVEEYKVWRGGGAKKKHYEKPMIE